MRELVADGSIDVLPTREQMKLKGELAKLETNLGGVAGMDSLPSAVFVVDPRKEAIVVKEARKLGIPIVGAGRHELRPRRGRLRHPRQRRRHPLVRR